MYSVLNIRKAIAVSFLTAMLGGAGLVSRANGHEPVSHRDSTATNSPGTAEVKYVPGPEGQGIFKVLYNNAAGSRFRIRVLDVDGNQLYQNIYTDKKFDKNFKLADPDSYGKLIFVIHNLEDNSVQRFEVESSFRLVEEIDVKEVK
jgi:hypothetical protein